MAVELVGALLGWLTEEAGSRLVRRVRRLLCGEPRQRALRAVVVDAVDRAVAEADLPDEQAGHLRAVLLEHDVAPGGLHVSTAAELRAALETWAAALDLPELGGPGYLSELGMDPGSLANRLADRIEVGIRADGQAGGPLGTLAEWLWRDDTTADLEQIKAALNPVQVNESAVATAGYIALVRDIAPTQLYGRDDELAEIARFCAGDEPYLCWQADPWAGKTALAAWTVLHPPEGVRVASFFVTASLSGQANSDAFTEAVIKQLAVIADEPIAAGQAPADRDRERRRLLDLAAARAREQGDLLLLVVDGLDEDEGAAPGRTRPSIASLLPARPPAGVKVMVTRRPYPEIPDDVPTGHPLRVCAPRPLRPSEHAGDLRVAATHELNQRLNGGDQAQVDVIGYLTAAGGGLTLADLVNLTETPGYRLNGLLAGAFGRSLSRRTPPDGPPGQAEPFYLFAHETLRETAESALAQDLDGYRPRIHAWADEYRAAGWPEHTPPYLLLPYGRLLAAIGDLDRLVALATDPNRHDRMLVHTHSDAAAFAEIATAQQLLLEQPAPNLTALGVLAVRRMQLANRSQEIPSGLPALWARLGDIYKAEALARGFDDAGSRAQALAAIAYILADHDDDRSLALVAEAEQITGAIADAWVLAQTLGALSKALIASDPDRAARLAARAEEVARTIDDPDMQEPTVAALVDAFADARMWERVARVARSVEEPDYRAAALDGAVRALAKAGQWDGAEELALEIGDTDDRGQALAALSEALAAAHVFDRAESVARSVDDDSRQAVALAAVAQRLPSSDPDRAVQLVTEAYQMAVTRAAAAWINVSTAAALVLTDMDPAAAAQLAAQAEQLARGIGDIGTKVRALALLAKSFANTASERTTALAAEARRAALTSDGESTRTWIMTDLAQTLIEAGLWDQAELAARDTPDPRARAQLLTMLADALAGVDQTRAERVALEAEKAARSITRHEWPPHILHRLLEALVRVRSWERAEQVATAINSSRGDAQGSYYLATALAETQQWERAEQVVGAIDNPQRQAHALSVLTKELADAGLWQRAEQVAGAIISRRERARALAALSDALADAHRWDDAERIARSIADQDWELRTLGSLVESVAEFDPERAVRLAAELAHAIDGLGEPERRTQVVRLCRALAGGGQWDLAENIARAIDDPEQRRQAFADLGEAYAKALRWEDAKRLARSMDDPLDEASALITIIPIMARTDPAQASDLVPTIADQLRTVSDPDEQTRALIHLCEALTEAHLVVQAEQTARIIQWPSARAQMLTAVAKVVVCTAPLHAAELAGEAEQVIDSIEDPGSKAWASAGLARAFADAHLWDKALRIADGVDYPEARSWGLLGLAEATAKANRWDEAEQDADRISDPERQTIALQLIIIELVQSARTEGQPDPQSPARSRLRRILALSLAGADPFPSIEAAASAMATEIAELCDALVPAMLD